MPLAPVAGLFRGLPEATCGQHLRMPDMPCNVRPRTAGTDFETGARVENRRPLGDDHIASR